MNRMENESKVNEENLKVLLEIILGLLTEEQLEELKRILDKIEVDVSGLKKNVRDGKNKNYIG